MSFLYELGINEFVQNVTNLLRDPNDHLDYNRVFAGYIDDLYWAATFDKMVEVIKFVLERGPAYGYWIQTRVKFQLFDSFLGKILQPAILTYSASKAARSIAFDLKKILPSSEFQNSS